MYNRDIFPYQDNQLTEWHAHELWRYFPISRQSIYQCPWTIEIFSYIKTINLHNGMPMNNRDIFLYQDNQLTEWHVHELWRYFPGSRQSTYRMACPWTIEIFSHIKTINLPMSMNNRDIFLYQDNQLTEWHAHELWRYFPVSRQSTYRMACPWTMEIFSHIKTINLPMSMN